MTRPHADIATVAELRAADGARIVEIAAWAKTRVKTRGLRAASDLSVVEIAAMVIVLDFHLADHKAVSPPAAPAAPAAAAAAPDTTGLTL